MAKSFSRYARRTGWPRLAPSQVEHENGNSDFGGEPCERGAPSSQCMRCGKRLPVGPGRQTHRQTDSPTEGDGGMLSSLSRPSLLLEQRACKTCSLPRLPDDRFPPLRGERDALFSPASLPRSPRRRGCAYAHETSVRFARARNTHT